jgi:3,4-dihydroxy 2-butanone 4-phosphate synthase/GTP cyclohydrolase II
MDTLEGWLEEMREQAARPGRPLVTLSYAQSLDGCLAFGRGQPAGLSGAPSMRMTHRLRSLHDTILVGIGTVLSDDPQLNVRLVEGKNPQPVVIDSRLRFPLTARLLKREKDLPWIAAGRGADANRIATLERQGARVIPVDLDPTGGVLLDDLLVQLYAMGTRSLMVEGGARVITSFLAARLADLAVVTIAPVYLGGLHVVDKPLGTRQSGPWRVPVLAEPCYQQAGRDMVVWGRVQEQPV